MKVREYIYYSKKPRQPNAQQDQQQRQPQQQQDQQHQQQPRHDVQPRTLLESILPTHNRFNALITESESVGGQPL